VRQLAGASQLGRGGGTGGADADVAQGLGTRVALPLDEEHLRDAGATVP